MFVEVNFQGLVCKVTLKDVRIVLSEIIKFIESRKLEVKKSGSRQRWGEKKESYKNRDFF